MGALPEPLGWGRVDFLRKYAQNRAEETKQLETVRPRRVFLVPTYAVGLSYERRCAPRAYLNLPLRLVGVDGQTQAHGITLVTKNISSSGVFFLAPCEMQSGTPIEMEVGLLGRPLGQGSVRMRTAAHIVRVEESQTAGWKGYAAVFDDIAFKRDDSLPHRYGAQ
jgi:hypothetical protein